MEQMELEIREIDPSFRPRLKTRVDSYKAELSRLLQDFNSAKSSQFKSDGNLPEFIKYTLSSFSRKKYSG